MVACSGKDAQIGIATVVDKSRGPALELTVDLERLAGEAGVDRIRIQKLMIQKLIQLEQIDVFAAGEHGLVPAPRGLARGVHDLTEIIVDELALRECCRDSGYPTMILGGEYLQRDCPTPLYHAVRAVLRGAAPRVALIDGLAAL
jgi:hypothetical protein